MATLATTTILTLLVILSLSLCSALPKPQLQPKTSPSAADDKPPLKKKLLLSTPTNKTKTPNPKTTTSNPKNTTTTKLKLTKTTTTTTKTNNATTPTKTKPSNTTKTKPSNTTKPSKPTLRAELNTDTNQHTSPKPKPTTGLKAELNTDTNQHTTPRPKPKPNTSLKAELNTGTNKSTTPKPKSNPNYTSLRAGLNTDTDQPNANKDDNTGLRAGLNTDTNLFSNLRRLSTTSKAYILAANRGLSTTSNLYIRPLVGANAAASFAPIVSAILVAAPLLLLAAAALRRLPAAAAGRLLVATQAYLAVYFATLAGAALAAGVEPLQFLHVASPRAYTWTLAVQTTVYLVYLVAQVLDLVGAFAGDADVAAGAPARLAALAQMVVGLGVGVHYYTDVFWSGDVAEGPRGDWRVHGVYATCFTVIGWCAGAQRRKKLYEGEEDGKKS